MNIAAGGARVRSRRRRVRGRHRGSDHAGRRAPDPLGDQQMSLTPRRKALSHAAVGDRCREHARSGGHRGAGAARMISRIAPSHQRQRPLTVKGLERANHARSVVYYWLHLGGIGPEVCALPRSSR
jgi:hypothetical protein